MSTWYERGVFYHMYPLGMTGAPKHNDATEVTNRFEELDKWISHIRFLDSNRVYICISLRFAAVRNLRNGGGT